MTTPMSWDQILGLCNLQQMTRLFCASVSLFIYFKVVAK